MLQNRSNTKKAQEGREYLARKRAGGLVRVGLNVHQEKLARLDQIKQAHGFRSRDEAFDLLMTEYEHLVAIQARQRTERK